MRKAILFLSMLFAMVVRAEIGYYELVDSADYYINKEEYAKAEETILRALRLEPANYNNSLLLSNLGTIQRRQGRLEEAVKNYTFAIYMTPNAVTLLKNRAAVYVEMDSIDHALSDYKKIVSLDKDDIESRYYCALIYLDKGRISEAQDIITELKDLDGKCAETQECLARMHQAMGHYTEAAGIFSQLLRDNSGRDDLLVHRAECYLGANDLQRAALDIEECISLNPTDGYMYILKARLKKKLYLSNEVNECISLAVKYGIPKSDAEMLLRVD